MADRFPLILNTSANQIQEIASGDTLDLSNNNISNAGIITASSFSGPIVAGAGVSNITAGIITATKIDLNGDLDVDGHTNLDNVSVGGATTMSGNLTISNAAPTITLTDSDADDYALQVNGGSFIIHDTTAGANRLSITDAGNVDINGDLDIDGHTNLDNLNVAGVSTFAGAVTTGDHITLSGVNPRITFTDSNHNPDFELYGSAGNFKIWDSTSSVGRLVVNSDGHIDIPGNLDCGAGIDVTGNATVSGNLSVGGVLTYEDVTNVDSVGIVTARNGIFVPDSQSIHLGNVAGGGDLQLFHNGSHSYIKDVGTGSFLIQGSQIALQDASGNNHIITNAGTDVQLYYDFANNTTPKLKTTATGVTIDGTATATTFSGSGASLTSLPAANLTGTAAAINGSNITNVNAASVGGIAAGSFLRSDASDTYNCNGFNLGFDFDASGRDSITFYLNGTHKWGLVHDNGGNDINFTPYNSAGSIKISGNRILTTADEGSGNGIDADTVDGIQGSNILTLSGTQTIAGTKTFNCSGYDVQLDYDSTRTLVSILRSGTEKVRMHSSGDTILVETFSSGVIRWKTGLVPNANDTYDLGSTSLRWRNAYVNDMHFSNEGSKNNVDGTWGDWTLQEGDENIFMLNNRTGKKYKMNLTEVE